MKSNVLKTTAIVAALALGTVLVVGPVFAHGPGGPGGYGMQGGHMGTGMMGDSGHGMLGSMMGAGMMGSGYGAQGDCPGQTAALGKDLTVDGVTKLLEQRLSHMGNDRLKVGEVKAKDDNTITAEIVTVDGSLVQKLEFNRDSGRSQPVR